MKLWHTISASLTLTLCDMLPDTLSDKRSLTIWLWPSLTCSLWHTLSYVFSLTCSLCQYKETCLHFPPPICGPHLSIYTSTIGIHLFDWRVRVLVLEQGMSWDISYRCNGVPMPERSSISFNINRTLLPSTSKSIHFFHVRNELIELIMVFGICVSKNKSSFEDVVEFRFA